MRKLISVNILLFVSVCLVQAQTLDEIVSKHLEAMGGAKTLRAVQTLKMERVDADDPEKGNSIIIFKKRGDKFRVETVDITPVMKMRLVQGCDGKNSWTVSAHAPGATMPDTAFVEEPPTIRPADESCKSIADIDGPLLDYKTKEGSLALAAIQKVGGADAYDVRFKSASKEHVATHFYIDKKSFLLVKVAREADGMHTEDLYTDYRRVDGMMVPFLWETRWWAVRKAPSLEENAASEKTAGPEGSNKQIVKSIQFNVPLPDSLFAPPSSATAGKNTQPAGKK